MPPTTKKNSAATPYMIPSFLWSTVKTHDRHPVAETGRRNTPYVVVGVTRAGAAGPVVAGIGRSMMAMVLSLLSVAGQQVGDDLVDLVLGQGEVRHAAGLAVG